MSCEDDRELARWHCHLHASCIRTRFATSHRHVPNEPSCTEDLLDTLANDDMITIYAKDDARPLKIQRALLVEQSTWFRKALTGKFKEAQTRTPHFRDSDRTIVADFLHWLFRGYVQFRNISDDIDWDSMDDPRNDNTNDKEVLDNAYLHAVKLWAFADAHLLPTLQNHVMDELHRLLTHWFPAIEIIRACYEMSPAGSKLRRLAMDGVSEGLRQRQMWKEGEVGYKRADVDPLGANPRFTADLVNALTVHLRTGKAALTFNQKGAAAYHIEVAS